MVVVLRVQVAVLVVAAAVLVGLAAAPPAEAAPKRIVALTPFAANTLANLGIKPVGIGETLGGQNRFSRKLRGVRRLPLSHPNGPNFEQLATLAPDLVISTPTWRKGHETMRELRIRVVESEPRSIARMVAATRRIGRLVGRPAQANILARRIAVSVKRQRRGIKRRPSVLLILGVGRTPFAFLPASWGGDVVAKAGGRLLTRGLKANGGFARISDETVVARDPDVIIAVPHANARDIPSIAAYLRDNPAWRTTKAVRNRRVHISTDNSLLQAGTDIARTIKRVRAKFLRNR